MTAGPRRARDLLPELGLVAGGFVGYLLVRLATVERTEEALAHAADVLALEAALGIDHEHVVQAATSQSAPWLSHLAAHFYVWGYFPVLVGAAVWLYLRHPADFRRLRTALVVSGLLGLIVYALYPVAPPWLSDDRFVDSVGEASLDAFARPGPIMNELGAIPSFHCGWLTVAAVVVFGATRSPWLRALCVVHPLLMCFAVVVTGNHWYLDIPAGLALAGAGLLAATWHPAVARPPAARHSGAAAGPG